MQRNDVETSVIVEAPQAVASDHRGLGQERANCVRVGTHTERRECISTSMLYRWSGTGDNGRCGVLMMSAASLLWLRSKKKKEIIEDFYQQPNHERDLKTASHSCKTSPRIHSKHRARPTIQYQDVNIMDLHAMQLSEIAFNSNKR